MGSSESTFNFTIAYLTNALFQRNGYLYIIDLLINHNADPNISDSQGYNTLHLVTHSSTVMPLLYLLHQPISPDVPDAQGHTSLMWAAYQGDAISVELLLNHGASVRTKDNSGLTPLHWAVVRGNRFCIRKLLESGADMSAKDDTGKTPKEMAVELKSLGPWKRALEEAGMTEDGRKIGKPLSEVSLAFTLLQRIPNSTCRETPKSQSSFYQHVSSTLSSTLLPFSRGSPLFPLRSLNSSLYTTSSLGSSSIINHTLKTSHPVPTSPA